MKIDYSIPLNSKKLLYADFGIRHGIRHLKLATNSKIELPLCERISHLSLGVFKMIPVLGHLAAWVDKKRQVSYIQKLTIRTEDSYSRGEELGITFKKTIQEIYRLIISTESSEKSREEAKLFEKQIPDDLRKEMQGLAKGAEVPYDDVLLIHTFLDSKPGTFFCSAMAKNGKEQRIAAANHRLERDHLHQPNRRKLLLQSSGKTSQEMLQSSNVEQTVQSIIFNPASKSIQLSSAESNAAFANMKTFTAQQLFRDSVPTEPSSKMELLRNLDWPWYFLGQNTLLYTRPIDGKLVTSVTFPGYLGSLSGMNEKGLCLAACSRDSETNLNGMPNPLFFTKLLAKCSSAAEAIDYLNKTPHGSSMNLMVADQEEAHSIELWGLEFNIVGTISPIVLDKAAV
jgi:hypothetical protein